MNHLFEDLLVIDAASFLAGPGATTILGDFGARVIKIEPPQGMDTGCCMADIDMISTGR